MVLVSTLKMYRLIFCKDDRQGRVNDGFEVLWQFCIDYAFNIIEYNSYLFAHAGFNHHGWELDAKIPKHLLHGGEVCHVKEEIVRP